MNMQQRVALIDWLRENRATFDHKKQDEIARSASAALGFTYTATMVGNLVRAGIVEKWKQPHNPVALAAMAAVRKARATKLDQQFAAAHERLDAAFRDIAALREQMQRMHNSLVAAGFVMRKPNDDPAAGTVWQNQ